MEKLTNENDLLEYLDEQLVVLSDHLYPDLFKKVLQSLWQSISVVRRSSDHVIHLGIEGNNTRNKRKISPVDFWPNEAISDHLREPQGVFLCRRKRIRREILG